MSNTTKEWKLYLAGKKYNNQLKPSYYDTVNANIDFFNGNQWRNVEANGMPTPVFNIIKRVITFFVASITANKVKVQLEPLTYKEDEPTEDMEASDIATAEIENLFEKIKMDNRIRDALFDAGTIGDVGAHIYFDMNKKPYGGDGDFKNVKGEICFELVDGTNMMFGNANNPSTDVSIQPYIIVVGRDNIKKLKAEAKQYKQDQLEIENITEDTNTFELAGDMANIEIDSDDNGKALYIIVYKYDHDKQTVMATKCTENAYMYKDIDTGLSHYPVAWLNWEKQKNQYHGRAICTSIIPNQIFINRSFAAVIYHQMMAAFPKAVYDADKVDYWSNEIGQAIPIRNLSPGDSIKNVAGYLEPGNMSNQIVQVIELAIQYTKETLGISDAALGNVKPDNFKAIVATQESAAIPLENVKANLYEWIEDIGRILLDMIGTYYGQRPIVIKKDAERFTQMYDFSIFKDLWLNVRCDVGASSYWSELAAVETLDNLLKDGYIDVIDYLESMPEGYIPRKQELIDKIKQRQFEAQQMNAMANMPMQEQMLPEVPPMM